MDKYTEDKWYIKFYQSWLIDKKAAEHSGIVVPPGLPHPPNNYVPLAPTIALEDINIPMIDGTFKRGNLWNYPMLIEALEECNKPLRFSRADAKAATRQIAAKAKHKLSQEELLRIFLTPRTEKERYIRAYWLKERDLMKLFSYLGITEGMLVFAKELPLLENPPWEDTEEVISPSELSAAELTKLILTKGLKFSN